jgi:hypothetical protein
MLRACRFALVVVVAKISSWRAGCASITGRPSPCALTGASSRVPAQLWRTHLQPCRTPVALLTSCCSPCKPLSTSQQQPLELQRLIHARDGVQLAARRWLSLPEWSQKWAALRGWQRFNNADRRRVHTRSLRCQVVLWVPGGMRVVCLACHTCCCCCTAHRSHSPPRGPTRCSASRRGFCAGRPPDPKMAADNPVYGCCCC